MFLMRIGRPVCRGETKLAVRRSLGGLAANAGASYSAEVPLSLGVRSASPVMRTNLAPLLTAGLFPSLASEPIADLVFRTRAWSYPRSRAPVL